MARHSGRIDRGKRAGQWRSGLGAAAGHLGLRGNGEAAWPGWPTSPEIEALRAAWLEAPDQPSRMKICEAIQLRAWIDVPYIPLGAQYQPNAYSRNLSAPRIGFVQGYDVRRL